MSFSSYQNTVNRLEKEIADDVLKKTVEDKDYEVVEIK